MKYILLFAIASFVLRFCSPEDQEGPANSHKIYYLQGYPGNLYRVNTDGTNDLQLTTEGDYGNLDVSADGKKMVYASSAGDNWNIYIADLTSKGITNNRILYASNYRDEDCRFSPDGKKIVFKTNQWGIELYQNRNVYDLCLLDIATSKVTKLTSNAYAETWAPVFSRDGKKIAFVLRQSGQGASSDEIYIINTDGSALKRITNNSYPDWYPSFSKDGNLIYASQKIAECSDDLYLISKSCLNLASPEDRSVKLPVSACTDISDADPYASQREESTIAFVSTRDGGGYGIYLGDKSNGTVRKVIGKSGVDLLGPVLSK